MRSAKPVPAVKVEVTGAGINQVIKYFNRYIQIERRRIDELGRLIRIKLWRRRVLSRL
jgi:CBS-domain-containing membrane protein